MPGTFRATGAVRAVVLPPMVLVARLELTDASELTQGGWGRRAEQERRLICEQSGALVLCHDRIVTRPGLPELQMNHEARLQAGADVAGAHTKGYLCWTGL